MITWNEIAAECGNYRDRFVTVFRRHEGEPTDELDSQGRPIAVTVNSFAQHMGIPKSTLYRARIDTFLANRKAAEAWAAEFPEPVRRPIENGLRAKGWLRQDEELQDVADELPEPLRRAADKLLRATRELDEQRLRAKSERLRLRNPLYSPK